MWLEVRTLPWQNCLLTARANQKELVTKVARNRLERYPSVVYCCLLGLTRAGRCVVSFSIACMAHNNTRTERLLEAECFDRPYGSGKLLWHLLKLPNVSYLMLGWVLYSS